MSGHYHDDPGPWLWRRQNAMEGVQWFKERLVDATVWQYPPADMASLSVEACRRGSAVVEFMTWIWISVIVVLIGAGLNAELEHQTARDSTDGPERPLGARGATKADEVVATWAGGRPLKQSNPAARSSGPQLGQLVPRSLMRAIKVGKWLA
jgi:hypothetical protein